MVTDAKVGQHSCACNVYEQSIAYFLLLSLQSFYLSVGNFYMFSELFSAGLK